MSTPPDLFGIVPAAGQGSRISPLPSSKELFPVGFTDGLHRGAPRRYPKVVSQFLLEQMRRAGATRLMMAISPAKTDILQYYGDGSALGVPIVYGVQQEPWGMPYALDLAYPWLRAETISLFGMPDTVFAPPDALARLVAARGEAGADVALALFPTETPWHFGMVELDEGGAVRRIIDKPSDSALRFLWGAACWTHRFATLLHESLPATRPEREIVLGDLFQRALEGGMKVIAVPFEGGEYLDIGSPEGLQRVMAYSREQELGRGENPLGSGLFRLDQGEITQK